MTESASQFEEETDTVSTATVRKMTEARTENTFPVIAIGNSNNIIDAVEVQHIPSFEL
jgi:hypothetical protein